MASRMKREIERNIRSNDFLRENKADFAATAFATAQITTLKAKAAAWNFASHVERDAQPSKNNLPANPTP